MVKAGTRLEPGGREEAPPGGGERAGLSASRAAVDPTPDPREKREGGSQSCEPAPSPPPAASSRIGCLDTLHCAGLEDSAPGEASAAGHVGSFSGWGGGTFAGPQCTARRGNVALGCWGSFPQRRGRLRGDTLQVQRVSPLFADSRNQLALLSHRVGLAGFPAYT